MPIGSQRDLIEYLYDRHLRCPIDFSNIMFILRNCDALFNPCYYYYLFLINNNNDNNNNNAIIITMF